MVRGLGGPGGVSREETWLVEGGQQNRPEGAGGNPLSWGQGGGKLTVRWFEELWEFRLRREKGCLWGPSTGGTCCGLGKGPYGHDFWRR